MKKINKQILSVNIIILLILCVILVMYNNQWKYKKYNNYYTGIKYEVKIDNKIYENDKLSDYGKINTINQTKDILELHTRLINPSTNTSFRTGKYDVFLSKVDEQDMTSYTFYKDNKLLDDEKEFRILSLTKESMKNAGLLQDGVEVNLHQINISNGINKLEYADDSIPYKFKSHGALINISDPEKDTAIIEDVNGNFTIMEVYDKDKFNIFDLVANFEVFEGASDIKYAKEEYRDGVYSHILLERK